MEEAYATIKPRNGGNGSKRKSYCESQVEPLTGEVPYRWRNRESPINTSVRVELVSMVNTS